MSRRSAVSSGAAPAAAAAGLIIVAGSLATLGAVLPAARARDDGDGAPPAAADDEPLRRGRFTYYVRGRQTGGERYRLRRTESGGTRLEVDSFFTLAKVDAEGSLELDADGNPIAYAMRVTSEARGTTWFAVTFAREGEVTQATVTTRRGDAEDAKARTAEVAIDGPFVVIEEGVIALDEAALSSIARSDAKEATLQALVPQFGKVESMKIVRRAPDAPARAAGASTELVVTYRGGESVYGFDGDGRLLRIEAKAAAGDAVVVREKD